MKRLFILTLLLGVALSVMAQTPETSPTRRGSVKLDWMQPFEGVSIEGPLKVTLVDVGSEAMKISYDTKGNPDSRVKISVDKHGVLNVRERGRKIPTDTTEVRISYQRMTTLEVDEAKVCFEKPIRETMLDVKISGGAVVEADLRVHDLVMEVTGKCLVQLTGQSHYFDLKASTAEVDALHLDCESVEVNASHGARVKVAAADRLEAYSQIAYVYYGGTPRIVRTETSLLGGRVDPIDEGVAKEAEVTQ